MLKVVRKVYVSQVQGIHMHAHVLTVYVSTPIDIMPLNMNLQIVLLNIQFNVV